MASFLTERTEGALMFHETLAEQTYNLEQCFENYKSIPVIALPTYLPSFKFYQTKPDTSAVVTSFSIINLADNSETSLTTSLVDQSAYDSTTWQYYYNAKTVINTTLNVGDYYYVKIIITNTPGGAWTIYSDILKVIEDNLTVFELYQDADKDDYFKFWKETELYYNDSFEKKITGIYGSSDFIIQRSVWDVKGLTFGVNQSDINIASKIDKYRYVDITDRFDNLWEVDTGMTIEKSLEKMLDSEFYSMNIKFKCNKVTTTPALDVDSSNATFALKHSTWGSPFTITVYALNNATTEQPEIEEQSFRTAGKKYVEFQHTWTRKKIQFWLTVSDAEEFVKYFPISDDPEYGDAGSATSNIIPYEYDELKMTDIEGEDIRQIDLIFRIAQTDNYPLS